MDDATISYDPEIATISGNLERPGETNLEVRKVHNGRVDRSGDLCCHHTLLSGIDRPRICELGPPQPGNYSDKTLDSETGDRLCPIVRPHSRAGRRHTLRILRVILSPELSQCNAGEDFDLTACLGAGSYTRRAAAPCPLAECVSAAAGQHSQH